MRFPPMQGNTGAGNATAELNMPDLWLGEQDGALTVLDRSTGQRATADKVNLATGRGAAIVVAASDASDIEKAEADEGYLLTGDAATDTAIMQSANNNAGGGIVQILGHTVNVTSLTIDNCLIKGSGSVNRGSDDHYDTTKGTWINTTTGITLGQYGAMSEVIIHAGSSFSGNALSITNSASNTYGYNSQKLLDNIVLISDTVTQGTAIAVTSLVGNICGAISIHNFENGLNVQTSGAGFVNANIFDSLITYNTAAPLTLNNGGGGIVGNTFKSIMMQGASKPVSFVAAQFNNLPNVNFFDWDYAASGAGVTLDSDSCFNRVKGILPMTASDATGVMAVTDSGYGNDISCLDSFIHVYKVYVDYTTTSIDVTAIRGVYSSIDVEIDVFQAFNAGTSNTISVGLSGVDDTYFTPGISVSAVGRPAVTYTSGDQVNDFSVNHYTLNVVFAYSGAAPTQGKAIVYITLKN